MPTEVLEAEPRGSSTSSPGCTIMETYSTFIVCGHMHEVSDTHDS